MNESEHLKINNQLRIPVSELRYRFARSSGPGGQHVNRSETQVTLLWDVRRAASLTETQRRRIERALAGRIDQSGVLHLVSGEKRSQLQNRRAVTARLVALLREAVKPPKKRIPTHPSKAARARRLQYKRRRSQIKRRRGKVREDD